MSSLDDALRNELKRLLAKELREANLESHLKDMVHHIGELERRITALEKQVSPHARRARRATAQGARRGRKFHATPEVLRKIRNKLGLTQQEFARVIGVSGNAVWQWEAGRATPRGKTLQSVQAVRKMGKREARKRLEEAAGRD